MTRRKASDFRYENLNWAYLRKAIKDEGYRLEEVSTACGMSKGALSSSLRRGYIYESVLDQIKDMVTIDEGKLIAVPKKKPEEPQEPVKDEGPKMLTIDEAIAQLEEAKEETGEHVNEPDTDLGRVMGMLEAIDERLKRIESALERGGFMQISYEDKALGVLERLLEHGACSKEDLIREVVRLKIPQNYIDRAIEKSGCTVATSRDGRVATTWLIRG